MQGPLLADVMFPDVLVAKAYSHDSKSLDLVLYPGKSAGTFRLGFERLTPGSKYAIGNSQLTADDSGCASVNVRIDGRTPFVLRPL